MQNLPQLTSDVLDILSPGRTEGVVSAPPRTADSRPGAEKSQDSFEEVLGEVRRSGAPERNAEARDGGRRASEVGSDPPPRSEGDTAPKKPAEGSGEKDPAGETSRSDGGRKNESDGAAPSESARRDPAAQPAEEPEGGAEKDEKAPETSGNPGTPGKPPVAPEGLEAAVLAIVPGNAGGGESEDGALPAVLPRGEGGPKAPANALPGAAVAQGARGAAVAEAARELLSKGGLPGIFRGNSGTDGESAPGAVEGRAVSEGAKELLSGGKLPFGEGVLSRPTPTPPAGMPPAGEMAAAAGARILFVPNTPPEGRANGAESGRVLTDLALTAADGGEVLLPVGGEVLAKGKGLLPDRYPFADAKAAAPPPAGSLGQGIGPEVSALVGSMEFSEAPARDSFVAEIASLRGAIFGREFMSAAEEGSVERLLGLAGEPLREPGAAVKVPEMTATGREVMRELTSSVPEAAKPDPALRAQVHRQIVRVVAEKLSVMVKGAVSRARIQLHPPSLRKMNVEIRMAEKTAHIRVTVENQFVKHAVESDLKSLRSSLQDQGLTVDEFTVDINPRGDGSANFGQGFDDGAFGTGELFTESAAAEAVGAVAEAPEGPAAQAAGNGLVNTFA